MRFAREIPSTINTWRLVECQDHEEERWKFYLNRKKFNQDREEERWRFYLNRKKFNQDHEEERWKIVYRT